MRCLELRLPPLLVVVVFAVAMTGVAWLVPGGALGIRVRHWLAAGIALVGLAIALCGVTSFRERATTINPFTPEQTSALVVTGIYCRTRNPMYLGFALMLLAWAVFLGNLATALLFPLFIVYMNRFQIAPEERALQKKFGREFTDYCASVRRWW